ncbi:hypothetical protein E2I00_005016, partial [Balaenoptera physalus]
RAACQHSQDDQRVAEDGEEDEEGDDRRDGRSGLHGVGLLVVHGGAGRGQKGRCSPSACTAGDSAFPPRSARRGGRPTGCTEGVGGPQPPGAPGLRLGIPTPFSSRPPLCGRTVGASRPPLPPPKSPKERVGGCVGAPEQNKPHPLTGAREERSPAEGSRLLPRPGATEKAPKPGAGGKRVLRAWD